MMTSLDSDPRKEGLIYVLNMSEPVPAISPNQAAAFRRIGKESVPALAAAMGPGSTAEIEKRFATGRRCYSAWLGDTLAAYGWVSYEKEYVGELNLWMRLQPGEAYIWDCYTLPEFRKQHLYSALLSYIIGELRAEPLQRVWIGANLDNLPSQRGITRAGFHPVAEMAIARVLAMRLVWVIGLPGVPEELVAEARRVFLDNRDKVWLQAVQESRK